MKNNSHKIILIVSILLAVMIGTVSCIGLFIPDFYFRETLNWQTQSLGQDLVDRILVIPALLITSGFAYRKSRSATLVWGGVLLYLFYTFVIYCFDVHFNRLFVLYCIILGLLFYSLIYFFRLQVGQPAIHALSKTLITKIIGTYFLVISVMFYFLWLSEIVPFILQSETPRSLIETGLPTNPVHVIDLSVILPGIFITGVMLLKKKAWGFVLAPVLLTFFILMDVTIGTLIIMMKQKGLEGHLTIAFIMGFLALMSVVLLYLFLKQMKASAQNQT